MDKRGEIQNRWVRVFEQKTYAAKLSVLERIKTYIIDDVEYLMSELKNSETALAQELSGVSGRFGKLIVSEDGVLKFRINGKFVDIKTVVDALKELVAISKMPTLEKRFENKIDLKALKDVFEEKL